MNMLTKTLLLAGGLFLVAVLATNAKADPMVDQVFTPSVQLADDQGGFCSGEIIKSERDAKSGKVATYVLTAKHCVLDKNDNDVINVRKNIYDTDNNKVAVKDYLATVFGKSYKSDLALLKLKDEDTYFEQTAKVAQKDIKLTFGQTVDLVGYPLGQSMTWTEGKLGYKEEGHFTDVSKSGKFYRATPDVAPGSSGSSMFTFDNGEYKVIGITTGQFRGFTYVNYFTPIDEIVDYLDTAIPKPNTKKETDTRHGL